jgi:CHAT domain-containing protein
MIANPNNPDALETLAKREKLGGTIIELSKALITPIEAVLERLLPQSLCFIPAGPLSRVPNAALEFKERPLLEKFAVYQVPSLRILQELSESHKAKPRDLKKMSVVAMSSYKDKDGLLANAVECVAATGQFGNAAHLESAVNMDKQGFIEVFENCDVIHVGTHGDVVYEKPLSSYIDLQEQFSVSDLRGVKSRATLVFLSACFTGLGLSTLTDDMIGFQAQILESGALAFAGSLWNAHALASMFFVYFFYERLSSPNNPNQSLSEIFNAAQRCLRNLNRVEADRIIDKLRERLDRLKEAEGIPSDLLRDSERFFGCYEGQARDNFASPWFWAPFVLVGQSSFL